MKLDISRDAHDLWTWRFLTKEESIIAQGGSFDTKEEAKENCKTIVETMHHKIVKIVL